MVESPWVRRAGPGIAAIGALVLIASTTSGARPMPWSPPACGGQARVGPAPIGAWYRIDPTIVDGVLIGQRVTLGRADAATLRAFDLDPESFAAGPFTGTILVGTDDASSTRLSLVDVAAGCAWPIEQSGDVVRRATITPDGSDLIEFRVDRASRADLGIWRRPLASPADEARILPPIGTDERFGPTWLTELVWSDDGTTLAVQSCGEVACRVRWLDLSGSARGAVNDPSLGDLVGLTRERLVAHGACRGLPCPLRTAPLTGYPTISSVLATSAGAAVLTKDQRGSPTVVYEVGADGKGIESVGVDGSDRRLLAADVAGRRLVAGPAWSAGAGELPDGWIALGPDGRLPLTGPLEAVARRLSDGRTVPFGEVPR